MTKTIKNFVLLLFAFFSFQAMHSQMSMAYYGNANFSKFSVGYEFNDNLWSELRIYSGTDVDNITPEFVLNYNFTNEEYFKTYVGGGFVLNNLSGIVAQIGTQITPFENVKNFSFIIEFQPLYEVDISNTLLNGYGGIRYRFN